jgi:hypothetical protein
VRGIAMFDTVVLNPLNINLDFNNPRFSMFDFYTEEEIIRYLINFEQIKELAFQIVENGYNTIGERIIVLKSGTSGKVSYTVLEGNRRIASLKLLFQYSSLLSSSERKRIEQTKLNIKDFEVSCDVVSEASRDEALFKISAKHVDGIKTWSATDKRVFYHNLYTQYRKKGLSSYESLEKIKNITPEGKAAIRNSIQQLNYLTAVYNATKIYKPDLEKLTHLDTDVLVSRVLRPLIKELNLEFNDELQPTAKNEKIYHEILGLLGKAVWIDKKLDTRVFSVQGQWSKIVTDNEVVPGLAEKIREYKALETTESFNENTSENSFDNGTKNTEDSLKDNKKTSDSPNQETKYKFFVPPTQITIGQRNYDLTDCISLVDENNNRIPRQSSDYARISVSCSHQNIVIKDNIIDSISENGAYDIEVQYNGIIKYFKIFLNVDFNNRQQDYQVLFDQNWYDESLAKLSSNTNYFKICEVIKKLQNSNVLSMNTGDHIIIAFLLRNLIEYSTKAYVDLVDIKQPPEKLPALVSVVKNHLVTNKKLSKTEAKTFNKHDIDIETLNGLIHDYKTEISITTIQSIGRKFKRYFSVIFNRLVEGVNNG